MHFCMTAQYTPKSLNAILENPKTNRYGSGKEARRSRRRQIDFDVQHRCQRTRRSRDLRRARSQSASAMSGVAIASVPSTM